VELNTYVLPGVIEAIFGFETQVGRLLVAVEVELRLVSFRQQESLGSRKVLFVDEKIQVAKRPETGIPVSVFAEYRPFEWHQGDVLVLQFLMNPAQLAVRCQGSDSIRATPIHEGLPDGQRDRIRTGAVTKAAVQKWGQAVSVCHLEEIGPVNAALDEPVYRRNPVRAKQSSGAREQKLTLRSPIWLVGRRACLLGVSRARIHHLPLEAGVSCGPKRIFRDEDER
jgi:hypothetical protein